MYSDIDLSHWTPELREATGYDPETASSASDGVFWMLLSDFLTKFDTVNVTPYIKLIKDGGIWHKALVHGVFADESYFSNSNLTQF